MGVTMRLVFLIVLSFATPCWAEEEIDVRSMAIDGFRLGMTLEEVRAISPWIKTVAVTPAPGRVIGYRSTINDLTLHFTADNLGKELFRIEQVKSYTDLPDPVALLKALVAVYGPPSQTGRDMTTTHSCWGRCYGEHPRLLYQLKIFNMVKGPYPSSLLLRDPAIENSNREAYRASSANE